MKRFEVIVERPAERDLADIHMQIALDSPDHAAQWFNRTVETIRSLANSPRRCPIARESRSHDDEIRQLLRGNYRILFTIGDVVHVLHVRHAARLPLGEM